MRKILKKLKSNKGVSIVEAMVAMIVIVVVSGAAISCIEAFSVSSANMINRNEAITAAENALEIFKATKDYEEYRMNMMRFVMASTVNSSSSDDGKNHWDNYRVGGCPISIFIRYDDTSGKATFSVTVRDAKNHTMLNIENYEKILLTDTPDPQQGGNEP